MLSIDQERVQKMIDKASETVAHPEFLKALQKVRLAPKNEKHKIAKEIATIEHLESKEISLPKDFRITTRSFEHPEGAKSAGLQPLQDSAPIVSFENGVGTVSYNGRTITIEPDRKEEEEVIIDEADISEIQAPEYIQTIIREGIEEIRDFIVTPQFISLLGDLYERSHEERPKFVLDVVLSPEERARRGIAVPDGLVIQRSTFADGRPTLFCVSKIVPQAEPWDKVTITFDSDLDSL